ncbi:extracellular solute-binding protein [Amycolatopsis suaedae]|uniref:Extracellular solute-binding protein n=1 Tax=Amycolatopsis suaedae TaxID=2510978 RepID=A0A4Q7J5C3_9PSEU|nr:extracellular solute-binding protein [Amycolatopsis suaedae]RZQ61503.1 extracellular solute-binding protein [Amycolatopsis suaedae]
MARRRIRFAAALVVTSVLAATSGACTAPTRGGGEDTTAPEKPAQPITLTVLDGGGDLATNKLLIENFVKARPELVASVRYETASAPDTVGKLKAQQAAGAVDIGLLLGGTDVLGGAIEQKIVRQLLPSLSAHLPDLNSLQDDGRRQLQTMAQGYGVECVYTPSGPVLAFDPAKTSAPRTPQALLEWAKANPGKFSYAQPANSGSGRTFLMSLPYLLGDSNPADPVGGWAKTWAYLKELGRYVSSYPASSTILAKQFGDGSLGLIPTIVAHDVSNRQNGTWSPATQVALFDNQAWVADAHYMMVPNGVSPQTLYVVLELMKWVLRHDQQVLTYSQGVLTTAIAGTSVDQADAAGKEFVAKWGRKDFYPAAFANGVIKPPLAPSDQLKAFDMWSREVGSRAGG